MIMKTTQKSKAFIRRHIGSGAGEPAEILKSLRASSLKELTERIVPPEIRTKESFPFPPPLSEEEMSARAVEIGKKNRIFKSYIGRGYNPCVTPPVIARNVLENPAWYTSYTPYQPELAQGRLEALLNFQTMTADLTGMELANSSLLDEGTATAEAFALAKSACEEKPRAVKFFVDRFVFPQTVRVLETRAKHFGWEMEQGDFRDFSGGEDYFSALVQYPDSRGEIPDIEPFLKEAGSQNIKTIVATDLLSLCLLKPPGEMGADVVTGSSQRFGLPLFFGGPHAAFFATRNKYARLVPGRIVGLSKDRHARPALRLALQTREQHIRRERATSNICTSQVFPALIAGFYAVYHGPQGLKGIADRVHQLTKQLWSLLSLSGFQKGFEAEILTKSFFDTLQWRTKSADKIYQAFLRRGINVGRPADDTLSWTLNETTGEKDLKEIFHILRGCLPPSTAGGVKAEDVFPSTGSVDVPLENSFEKESSVSLKRSGGKPPFSSSDNTGKKDGDQEVTATGVKFSPSDDTGKKGGVSVGDMSAVEGAAPSFPGGIPPALRRKTPFLTHPIFNSFHSETEMLRYIHRLEKKELSLTHSMIPLGSCTMKLNATAEMKLVSLPAFADIHPFAPKEQAEGYEQLVRELEKQLCALTGFNAFSFQPNAGSQGEYAGLTAIKKYHESRGRGRRNICLIPVSAHGTNPASAQMAGLKTVPLNCTLSGAVDLADLDKKLETHGDFLAGAMITYPSTYGVFEPGIKEICQKVRNKGGRVYLDGANMNALLGLCKPRSLGFDVCHLNLHKTFCIPHGGGGPGVGPVGVTEELAPFLPGDISGAVSSAPLGNAGVLIVSWAYITLMGYEGLKKCAEVAMANANYVAEKLRPHYRILFTDRNGCVAHECIVDFRKFKNTANITVEDVAKRLMDYSFHAPTMSWPVPGTLMVEPTESESKGELDKFCSALISIKKELEAAEKDPDKKALLKNAPHTVEDLTAENWPFPYTKSTAFYPLPWIRERKFWTPVSRVENAFGDINLFCSCPPWEMEEN